LEICAKGVRLGEKSAERKTRLFSAYVAAEAATHKASLQRKIKKKEQIPRCARDDKV